MTFVPVITLMPCFLNDRSSSADTASSSMGTNLGRSSTIVTSLPKRRKIEANSTPTAPLPMITIDFGTSRRLIASSLVMIRLLVDFDAWNAARLRAGGHDDLVASR